MLRRTFVSTLGASVAAPALITSSRADDWPARQVKVVIPYPPGGPTDISTRIVMEKAGQLLGQPILFDNKGGASGMIGAEYAKTQPADGYTFLAATVAMVAITRHLQPIPFDPDKDFLTVARMSTSWAALAVHPSVPANTMAEFIEYVRANPGKVNYGSAGLATITHLYGEILNLEAGIKLVHVPYKGSAQATQDLLGGQVQAQFDQTVLPHVLAGRLKGLAIIADGRWPHKPEIPTLKETGYGKQGGESWYGVLAPAGTPAAIVTKMSAAIDKALKSPDVLEKLDKGGAKATYLDPAAMRAQIDTESRYFADVIKRGNVKIN
ncbi:MAG: tripartite tricarboxylate transporter substrate binding protein [Proteobacteria bacterium]|nr:tripartite tricarboxylate transporter substrate binding protein [Pseudomonadota bacterium]